MQATPWIILFLIAAMPVASFLLFLKFATRGRKELAWEHRATYLAYGILAVLLVSLVLGRLIVD